jgi:hypothetical protein
MLGIPAESSVASTAARRSARNSAIWRTALSTLDQQGKLDWSMAFRDGSFAPAKKGGEKVGVTKKGRGTKWMLVVDGHGLPLGFHLDSANTAEVRLAEQTLHTIGVSRSRGRPKRRPEKLVVDRAYDSRARSAVRSDAGASACASRRSNAR